MNKIKINLSSETVKHLLESIDYGSAQSRDEVEAMYRVMDDLDFADDHRDGQGRLEITRETLDWALSELDWYCSAYHDKAFERLSALEAQQAK